ncbi:ABC-2 type transport system ATP-binding protein [Roseivirga ehrenbergii]|uniref:ABC transporter ATP-binding protein n=1 Tax=Roseivirga ehrenbergii (strain DSM 102268 / JCM 13514 / KCTC 12282 / NCIMB 14502 / KMM 6017) TaxID=279360 RepID=A0A150XSQ1_ROSEK|nr:ABC transporter ATP-binding protein [Roseivirga ehrenbergii]KYG81716.1 ABC transporter ATP-binding protein [Roseivirga ehrenbergii]TCL10894.1 ABC-2 type transport system ATP-binding protein [Roseivirga ehrenbergii]
MLHAVNLTKKYQESLALDNLNLSIEPGDIYCLLGANGAGKSTTINLFLNFIAPTSGKAIINQIEVSKDPQAIKKLIAYIPENLVLYNELSGLENLEYFVGLAGMKYHEDEMVNFLQEAGLQDEAFKKRVKTYSKGMRQKIGVAMAIAKKARVLLLDEPTSGLDPKASNEFSELLLRLSQQNVATLMATHDLFRAKETGTDIGIMKSGKLVEQLSTEQINHSDLEKLYLNHMNS